MLKNKHGLSRDIPESVKRQVRQDCGFGCVVCATALYEYEHIDPTFAEARDHRAECIGLLCPNCHVAVTRGLRSKEEIKRAREHPACLARGFSKFDFQFEPGAPLDVILGRITFRGVENILAIDGTPILAVCPPRHPTEPPLLSAVFFDRNETTIAKVIENEWQGSAEAFDITTRGALFSIRSELRKCCAGHDVNVMNPEVLRIEKSLDPTIKRIAEIGYYEQGGSFRFHQVEVLAHHFQKRVTRKMFDYTEGVHQIERRWLEGGS